MMKSRIAKLTVLIAATLAGGTMFGTCQTRIQDSLTDGTRLFIVNLLDPGNFEVTLD